MSRACCSKLPSPVVESRTRAVAYRTGGACCERRLSWPLSPRSPSLRLSSPLIEPDVTISVIRLSDGFHGRHSQRRAAEAGQEPERPVPPIRRRRDTAQTHPPPPRPPPHPTPPPPPPHP